MYSNKTRLLSFLLVIVMLFTSSPLAFANTVTTNGNSYGEPGSANVTASAEWANVTKTEALVTLDFNSIGSSGNTATATDFYFVVDAGASLYDTRLTNVKSALTNAAQLALGMNSSNRVSLIKFGRGGTILTETPVNNLSAFTSQVNTLTTGEKSNYVAGLNAVLKALPESAPNSVIIFVTASSGDEYVGWEFETVINELKNKNISIHAIQYMQGTTENEGLGYMDANIIFAPQINDINAALSQAISKAVSAQSMTNVTMTIPLNSNFEFISGSGHTTSGTISGSGNTVTWSIPSVLTGVSTNATFRMKLKSHNLSGDRINAFNGATCSYTSPVLGTQNLTLTSPTLSRSMYTVTYTKGSGITGTVPTDSKGYFAGQTVYVQDSYLTKDNSSYVFAGWRMQGDTTGETILTSFIMPENNVVLEPLWGRADVEMGTGTVYSNPMIKAGHLNQYVPGYKNIKTVQFIDIEKTALPSGTKIDLAADSTKPVTGVVSGTTLYIGAAGGAAANTNANGMFWDFTALESIKGNLNTSQTTTIANAFRNCINLRDISSLSTWDVSNVQNAAA